MVVYGFDTVSFLDRQSPVQNIRLQSANEGVDCVVGDVEKGYDCVQVVSRKGLRERQRYKRARRMKDIYCIRGRARGLLYEGTCSRRGRWRIYLWMMIIG